MKIIRIFALIIITTISSNSFAQNKVQKDTVTVHGVCGMCKKKIEKAAKEAGAIVATWSKESKVLKVSYNPASTSNQKIQESIAAVGYDTRDLKAKEDAYNSLEECCRSPRVAQKL